MPAIDKTFFSKYAWRVLSFVALVALAGLPSDGIDLPVCAFKQVTGFAGPLCGLTRALSSALHFRFADSLAYHPAGIPVLLYLALVVVSNEPNVVRVARRVGIPLSYKFFGFGILTLFLLTLWIGRVFVPEFFP